ncbi:hypothetical protein JCM3765_005998 [Sporobolomyces pararoseus]
MVLQVVDTQDFFEQLGTKARSSCGTLATNDQLRIGDWWAAATAYLTPFLHSISATGHLSRRYFTSRDSSTLQAILETVPSRANYFPRAEFHSQDQGISLYEPRQISPSFSSFAPITVELSMVKIEQCLFRSPGKQALQALRDYDASPANPLISRLKKISQVHFWTREVEPDAQIAILSELEALFDHIAKLPQLRNRSEALESIIQANFDNENRVRSDFALSRLGN